MSLSEVIVSTFFSDNAGGATWSAALLRAPSSSLIVVHESPDVAGLAIIKSNDAVMSSYPRFWHLPVDYEKIIFIPSMHKEPTTRSRHFGVFSCRSVRERFVRHQLSFRDNMHN